MIATSDGWMMGNGGLDGGSSIRDMERLAADMIKSNKIKMENLKKIQRYKIWANFGHFSIKAPDGRFAVIWQGTIKTGKLKPGEFLSNPNFQSYHRRGNYHQFGTDPAKVAIKVGATDHYGIYRRQIVVFHWKASTSKNFETTSKITVHAANDNGRLVGVSSASYVDDIKFVNKYIHGYKLPKSPKSMRLGSFYFGNIDKLIKTPTKIKAPAISNTANKTKYFKVSVINKKTGKAIPNLKIKVKVYKSNFLKVFKIKTDEKGFVKINTKNLLAGKYTVAIGPANNKYLISAKSKIIIKAPPKPVEPQPTEPQAEEVEPENATVDQNI